MDRTWSNIPYSPNYDVDREEISMQEAIIELDKKIADGWNPFDMKFN